MNSQTTTLAYDGANQLTSEVRTGPSPYSLSYLYDNNGNRTQKMLNGVAENYVYGPNDRIQSAGAKTYTTDNNGNITGVIVAGQTALLTWNFENKLTRIDYPGGSVNTFLYNGLGLRTRKVDSAGTFNYVCDGTQPGSSVLSDSAAVYTPGESERRGGTSKFYHGDALSSTRGITSSAQSATDSILYDAYGMTVSRTGTTPTPFGFVGGAQYQTDADSGLQLLGHRYYDPSIGRFITQDPARDGRNWFVYCGSNPLSTIDALGLWTFKIGASISFGALGWGIDIGGYIALDGLGNVGIIISHTVGGGVAKPPVSSIPQIGEGPPGMFGGGSFIEVGGSDAPAITDLAGRSPAIFGFQGPFSGSWNPPRFEGGRMFPDYYPEITGGFGRGGGNGLFGGIQNTTVVPLFRFPSDEPDPTDYPGISKGINRIVSQTHDVTASSRGGSGCWRRLGDGSSARDADSAGCAI